MAGEDASGIKLETWLMIEFVSALCAAIHKVVKPVNNTSMPPRYRRAMVKVLVKRACEGL